MFSIGYIREPGQWVVRYWDIRGKKLLRTDLTDFKDSIDFLDSSPNGELILAAGDRGKVDVFTKAGKKVTSFKMFEFGNEIGINQILDVKFLNNDEVLIVAPENIALRRNIHTNVSKLYYLRGRAPDGATISRESNSLAWVNDSFVYVWRPMLNRGPVPVAIHAPGNNYSYLVCSDDGTKVLCATADSELGLYDVKKGKLIKSWNGHEGAGSAGVCALNENKGFVTASEGGKIKIWRSDGELVETLNLAKDECIYRIRCNPGSTVLAIGATNSILVCDLNRLFKDNKGK